MYLAALPSRPSRTKRSASSGRRNECHVTNVNGLKARKYGDVIPVLHDIIEG